MNTKKEVVMYCTTLYGIHDTVEDTKVTVKKGKKYFTVSQGNGRYSNLRFHIESQTDMNGHDFYPQEYPEVGSIHYALYHTRKGAEDRLRYNQLNLQARNILNHLNSALSRQTFSNVELEYLLQLDPSNKKDGTIPGEYNIIQALFDRNQEATVVAAMAVMITHDRDDVSVTAALQLAKKIDSLCCRTDEAAYSIFDYVDALIHSNAIDIQKLMSMDDDAFDSAMIEAAAAKRRTYCDLYVECDSETCMFNPHGTCLAPIITGHAPRLCEEGCLDWRERDWENRTDEPGLKCEVQYEAQE